MHYHLVLIICVLYQSPAASKKWWQKKRSTFQNTQEITTITPVSIPSNFVIYKTMEKCAVSCTAKNSPEDFNFCVMVNLGRFICCNDSIQICQKFSDENEKEFLSRLDGMPINSFHPCRPNPCRHGGTCVESPSGAVSNGRLRYDYRCECPAGLTGERCHLSELVEEQTENTQCKENTGAGGLQTCYHGECVKKEPGTRHGIPRDPPWNRMVITEARRNLYEDALHTLYNFKNSEVCVCYPGYRGVDCKRACKPGTWGFYCLLKCDPLCRNGQCHYETGQCDCSDGYVVDEETASCLPDFRPGHCKKLCEDFGRGKCVDEICHCNEQGKGGVYCENSCSNFTRPRYGRKCSLPCGSCTVQPCDPVSGNCPTPSNNEPMCRDKFTGEQCIRLLDGVLTAELEVQYQLYSQADGDDWKFGRDLEQLLNSVESMQTLVDDLNLGFYSNVDVFAIKVKDTEVEVVGKKERSWSVRHKSARKLMQNDDSKLGVNFVASAPALYYNASKLKQAVNEGVLTMSRTFRTALAPGLRIDKNSIRVSKARMVRTSSQKVEHDTEGVSTILFGVLLGLVALMVVCIASFYLITRRTKTTARVGIAKVRKLNLGWRQAIQPAGSGHVKRAHLNRK